MKDPHKYFGTMRGLLLQFKQDAVIEEDIGLLLNNIVDCLTKWHEVFHALRSKERKPGLVCHLAFAVQTAVEMHRFLGLAITPKVHLIEDPSIQQYEDFPFSSFYCIEKFVEQNHQNGHKE